jgi:hypothetical protein
MDKLRPLMPPGFIPNVLPASLIERRWTRVHAVEISDCAPPRHAAPA